MMRRTLQRAVGGRLLLASLALPGAAQAAEPGAALFARHCAICHQADASGTIGLAPPLKGAHWVRLGADARYLTMVLINGLSGKIVVGEQTFVGNMPAFGPQLDDASLAAIAGHLRQLQSEVAEPAPTAEAFAAQRQLPGSPPQSRQRRTQLLGG